MGTWDTHINQPSVHAPCLKWLPKRLRTAIEAKTGRDRAAAEALSQKEKRKGVFNSHPCCMDNAPCTRQLTVDGHVHIVCEPAFANIHDRRHLFVKELGPKYRYFEKHTGEHIKQKLLLIADQLCHKEMTGAS